MALCTQTPVLPEGQVATNDMQEWNSITSAVIPMVDSEILMQLIDDEQGTYRIRTGKHVRYLTVTTDVFDDDDTMCVPSLFLPALPPLPDTDWTHATITRDSNGAIESTFEKTPRTSARNQCHARFVDVLSVPRTERISGAANTYQVELDGRPAIAKIAHFEWQMPRIEAEIAAYARLTNARPPPSATNDDEPAVALKVLGHLTENGRTVIGILLEKVPGTFASIDYLQACTRAVRRVHSCGIVHGDVNRYNFVVDRDSGHVRLVDFENSFLLESDEFATADEYASIEIRGLPEELAEETGRGGPSIPCDPRTFQEVRKI